MRELPFAVYILWVTAAFCWLVLATFYGAVRAFVGISWVPITLYVIVKVFIMLPYQPGSLPDDLEFLLNAVKWTSFVQGMLGIVITAWAIAGKRDWVLPALATVIALIPFVL